MVIGIICGSTILLAINIAVENQQVCLSVVIIKGCSTLISLGRFVFKHWIINFLVST